MTKKTIYLSTLWVLANCCFLVSPCQARYSGGTGDPNTPYQIADANDLNEIGLHDEDWGSHFILVNDINLAAYTGTQFNIIGTSVNPFTGAFDGNGHTISNFTYESNDIDYIGLFGYIDDPKAEIKDLILIDPNVDAVSGIYVGSLLGYFRDGIILGCSVEGGCVSGKTFVGGLVGYNGWLGIPPQGGMVRDCYSTCIVTGNSVVGGLVGYNGETVSNCYASAVVWGDDNVGGLVGKNYAGKISNCRATGVVVGQSDTGGLVGFNMSMISDCYATGDVTGNSVIGGLAGDNDGTISDCYAGGNIIATTGAGGLVGANSGTILGCYATGAMDGNLATGGLVGHNTSAISNCFAVGVVHGNNDAGGLVGNNSWGTIWNCYAAGAVDANDKTGGLVGANSGSISNCYAIGDVNGANDTGGFVGEDHSGSYTKSFWDGGINPDTNGIGNGNDPNVIGKSTAEMMQEATFTGWDFVEIWNMGENQTYPYLRVYPAGDLNHDNRIDFSDFAILALHWLEGTEP